MQELNRLVDGHGLAIPLKSVRIEALAQGLWLKTKTVQTYRNDSRETVEAVYTFPLAWGTVVTEFALTINGQRLVARSAPKTASERLYETVIDRGDMPVLLECDPENGVCTANIGNLAPRGTLTVELSCARVLQWDAGTVRIAIPTTVGRRRGLGAKLPHQQTAPNLLARYPVSARIVLEGALAHHNVSAPGVLSRIRFGGQQTVLTVDKASADRDLVVVVQDVPPIQQAFLARDGDLWTGFAALSPSKEGVPEPARINILADCSASMAGAKIEMAKRSLGALAGALADQDTVTLTVLGSGCRHPIERPSACTPHFLRRVFLPLSCALRANPGEAGLGAALQAATALCPGDILLVTDGDFPQADSIVRAARKAGRRVFALGIGMAPGDTLLARLADATGGACAFALPSEDIEQAVLGLLARMRAPTVALSRIACGGQPVARTACAHANASVALPLSFDRPPDPEVTARLSGDGAPDPIRAPIVLRDDPALRQWAAQARLLACEDPRRREAIALSYGLVSDRTNLVMVHTLQEKTAGYPALAPVPPMDSDIFCLRMACDQARQMDSEIVPESGPASLALDFLVAARSMPESPRAAASCEAPAILSDREKASQRLSQYAPASIEGHRLEESVPDPDTCGITPARFSKDLRREGIGGLTSEPALRRIVSSLPARLQKALASLGKPGVTVCWLAQYLMDAKAIRFHKEMQKHFADVIAADREGWNRAKTLFDRLIPRADNNDWKF